MDEELRKLRRLAEQTGAEEDLINYARASLRIPPKTAISEKFVVPKIGMRIKLLSPLELSLKHIYHNIDIIKSFLTYEDVLSLAVEFRDKEVDSIPIILPAGLILACLKGSETCYSFLVLPEGQIKNSRGDVIQGMINIELKYVEKMIFEEID